MMKTLRYSFLLVLAFLGMNNAMAEDIIWLEDFSSYAANDVPTGGTYNYVCEGSGTKIYNEKLAGGTAPELLVGKSGGSFSATIPLNGLSGEMTLAYKTNRNDLKVEVTGATLSEKNRVGNDDSYTLTVAAGTGSLTIKFYMTSSSNARLDDIKLYQGVAKKPAGLSWGKASTSVTFGGDYKNIPTLQNDNNLPVTCESTDPAVCTVTNEGVITVVGVGTTDVSASFAGNDEYEAQTVTITITVNPGSEPVDPDEKGQVNNPYTVEEAIAVIDGLESGKSSDVVYVKGYITKIDEVSVSYGNATYDIASSTTSSTTLKIYRSYYLDGEKFTAEDQIKVGDLVVVYGQLTLYNGTYEMTTGGKLYSLNGQTTGIADVKVNKSFEGVMYNTAGQVVNKSYKGLVIMNGKKFVNK